MKRIVVLSDTHIPIAAPDLPEAVYAELRTADMILHAGDLVEMSVAEKLESIAPTYAVFGNMDRPDVKAALPERDIIRVDGFKIGLMHGYGAPGRLLSIAASTFTGVDAVVFGHAHSPANERIRNVLLFNPGSPTDKIFAPFNSFGILEVGSEITGRIIKI